MEIIYTNSINRLFESVVWTHKIQRSYLESLELRRKIISLIEVVATSISSMSTLIFSIFNNAIGTIICSVATVASVILSVILSKVETKETIVLFRESSSSLCLLRDKIIVLSDEIKSGSVDNKYVKEILDNYRFLFYNYTEKLPSIPNKYVMIAKHKLKDREDEKVELDLFK